MMDETEKALRSLLDEGMAPSFRGKVREMLDIGHNLVMLATDRISAFDCVLPTLIPEKGKILTSVSTFWFRGLSKIVPTHFLSDDPRDLPEALRSFGERMRGRWMLVKKAKPLPVECIVRGYLVGSGWREYEKTGAIGGQPLPRGLLRFGPMEQPIFTPSTKSHEGHDENISPEKLAEVIGESLAKTLERLSLELYSRAARYALEHGLILADTKFEFGTLDGKVVVIDEVFTPDSSRYWPQETLNQEEGPKSLDKEFVRQYLKDLPWDGSPPAPVLPDEIVRETVARYREVEQRLTSTGVTPDLGDPIPLS
jgi:phosphoribosylaminoimidazole-succinocarboxamide synthase